MAKKITKQVRAPEPAGRPESENHIRASLLDVAAKEFATLGFAGARLEAIAAESGLTRAMIYYYFKGRVGLYAAVLDEAYHAIWRAEHAIRVESLSPEEALRKLVEFRVDYYVNHPTFVSLVAIENQLEAQHLKMSRSVTYAAAPALEHTAKVLAQGQALGVFRKDIDVVDLYQVIVSLGFFNVSNRHTFGTIFRRDQSDPSHVRAFVADVVLRYVAVQPAPKAARAPKASK